MLIPSNLNCIGFFIKSGSRNEKKNSNGVAHFLEHMLFKSNKKIKNIDKKIEMLGSSLNAYTSREHSLFYIEGLNPYKNIEILCNMIKYPKFIEKEILKEKITIKTEKIESEKNLFNLINEFGHYSCFGNTQMGRNILGNFKDIEYINRDKLIEYYKNNYLNKNFIVFSCGNNINHNKICLKLEKNFKNFNKKNNNENIVLEKNNFIKDNIIYIKNNQKYFGNGVFYKVQNYNNLKEYFSLLLIENILNNYNYKLKDINFKSIYNPYSDIGLFSLIFLTNNNYYKEKNFLIFINKLINQINMKEINLNIFKEKLLFDLYNIQTPLDYVNFHGTQIVYLNKCINKNEIIKYISSIDNKYIENIIKKYLLNNINKCQIFLNKNI
jgi:predicted Zn-dependent peptidase